MMLDLLLIIGFCWLFFKGVGLAFRVTWGLAKLVAGLLFVLALPMVILVALFAGGLFLLVPLTLVAIAFGILKAVV